MIAYIYKFADKLLISIKIFNDITYIRDIHTHRYIHTHTHKHTYIQQFLWKQLISKLNLNINWLLKKLTKQQIISLINQ